MDNCGFISSLYHWLCISTLNPFQSLTALENQLHVRTGHLLRIVACLINTWLIPQASNSADRTTQTQTQSAVITASCLPSRLSIRSAAHTEATHSCLPHLFITFYISKVSFIPVIFRCCSHITFHTTEVKHLVGNFTLVHTVSLLFCYALYSYTCSNSTAIFSHFIVCRFNLKWIMDGPSISL